MDSKAYQIVEYEANNIKLALSKKKRQEFLERTIFQFIRRKNTLASLNYAGDRLI